MLKIENLHIKYGAIHAVKGIDIEVNEGEIVTLIGANGAGKTSILKALSGLVKPSERTGYNESRNLPCTGRQTYLCRYDSIREP